MMSSSAASQATNQRLVEEDYRNQRLKEIREGYEYHLKTPQQREEDRAQTQKGLLEMMTKNGCSREKVAQFAADMAAINNLVAAGAAEEPERDTTVSWSFDYNSGGISRQITITSEGHRHWRRATTKDFGSIVFLPNENEFGEFDDIGEEPDEEFPDEEIHTTAIIITQSGKQETPWASNCGIFEFVLVVPEEILQGVCNEAPPGKFFSGRSSQGLAWTPAPAGQVWLQHPLLENPHGTYVSDRDYYHVENFLRGSFGYHDPQKGWELRGAKAYWCPILKRFITEGERLRSAHWFHNGDGSAQQRYFYDQNEMLDRHGGLASLPPQQPIQEVTVTEVRTSQECLNLKFQLAENQGKVINLE